MRSESSEGLQRLEYVRTHTQSLSGRSLGGLDRAAALPGMRRHGKRDGSLQESRQEEVLSRASRGVEFCVVIVAALIQKYARLITTTYSTGALRGTAGVPGSGPMVFGVLRVGAGVILGYPRVRIRPGIRFRLRDATFAS